MKITPKEILYEFMEKTLWNQYGHFRTLGFRRNQIIKSIEATLARIKHAK